MLRKPDHDERLLLKRRDLDWRDYVVVRALYSAVWFRNIHTGQIKIVNKKN